MCFLISFLHIDFCHYRTLVILNWSKWSPPFPRPGFLRDRHVHTCTPMCLWLFCLSNFCKLISGGLDPGSCSSPSPSPIIRHRVGCCSLTCGLQMAVLCHTARTGATVPRAKQLSRFATWHFRYNESHSLKSPCLLRGCIHNTENIKLSVAVLSWISVGCGASKCFFNL